MVDVFLQVPGIPGDSVTKDHEDWIVLLSANWGVENAGASGHAGGGAGAGRATQHPLIVNAPTSIATPLLFEAVVTGKHFPTATVDVVRAGEVAETVLRWEFEDVQLTLVDIAGSEPGFGDVFRVEAKRARITVYAQDPKGGAGQAVTRGWDFAQSRPW